MVTEAQFTCGLALASASRDAAQLSRDELQLVLAQLRVPNGINYKTFCRDVDSCAAAPGRIASSQHAAFLTGTTTDLERLPTAEPRPLTRGDVFTTARTGTRAGIHDEAIVRVRPCAPAPPLMLPAACNCHHPRARARVWRGHLHVLPGLQPHLRHLADRDAGPV